MVVKKQVWTTALLLALLSWSTVSCSTPSSHTSSSATPRADSPSAAKSPTQPPVKSISVCIGTMPSEWSTALSQGSVSLSNITFSPAALSPAGDVAFGYFQSAGERGIAAVNLATGRPNILSVLTPEASGVAWMSFADPWLAWAQGDSQSNMGQWSIELENVQTGEKLQIATSKLPDGSYLTGQLTFPIVGHGYVAWSQPTGQATADLRVYRLDSRQSLTLDSGRLSSPVFVGKNLVWAKYNGSDQQPSFRMSDADTLKAVPLPVAVASPQPITYLAGSQNYLVWTQGSSSLEAEQLGSGRLYTYSFTGNDLRHVFQFPMLAGHFLVWFAATVNTVMDLDTGNAFDVNLPSAVVGSGNEIVIAKNASGIKGAASSTTLSVMRLSPDTSIRSCTH